MNVATLEIHNRYSPWGDSDLIKQFDQGFTLWRARSGDGGGYCLSRTFARQQLTRAASDRSVLYMGYRWFSEEVDWAMVAYELPQYWPEMFEGKIKDPKTHLWAFLSRWRADYLKDRKIKPEPKNYALRKRDHLAEKLSAARDKDLIVSAAGELVTGVKGVVRVTTADGEEHTVTEASFDALKPTELPLLSNCERTKR